jgi:WbqC-like protein family
MKLAIMQPYLFPYIGYFQLMKIVDKWIVFDTVQYIYHGWINRNRILHPTSGWQYIIVPLEKHSRNTVIKDIKIAETVEWKTKILGQLSHYKKRAPFYSQTIELIGECLEYNEKSITRFNVKILSAIGEYLDLDFDYKFFSEMNTNLKKVENAGDWALNISKEMEVTQYINPISGKDLFDNKKFIELGIDLKFLVTDKIIYDQKRENYEDSLSIIDVLMWNSKDQIIDLLNKFELA